MPEPRESGALPPPGSEYFLTEPIILKRRTNQNLKFQLAERLLTVLQRDHQFVAAESMVKVVALQLSVRALSSDAVRLLLVADWALL